MVYLISLLTWLKLNELYKQPQNLLPYTCLFNGSIYKALYAAQQKKKINTLRLVHVNTIYRHLIMINLHLNVHFGLNLKEFKSYVFVPVNPW